MKTSVNNILKIASNQLSETQQKILQEFMECEKKAQLVVTKLTQSLAKVEVKEGKDFITNIKHSNLKNEEKTKVNDLFSQMVLKRFEQMSNKLYADLKKGEGYLYNALLSETVIDILDIILDFKASIDKYLPFPSEEILKTAAPFIITSIGMVAPGVAILLKTTGIIDKASEFLETKNLKTTIDKLKDGLENLKKDKTLEILNKTAELSKATGISGLNLNKIGFASNVLDIANKQVKSMPEVKSFLKEVAAYSEKMLPLNQSENDNKLLTIKKSALDFLAKNNAPTELLAKVNVLIDDTYGKVKEQLKPTLNNNVKLFDKISAQEKAAKLILDCSRDVAKISHEIWPNKKDIARNITDIMSKEVNSLFKGDLSKITPYLKHSAVKGFAKEFLGAGYTTIVKLEREAPVIIKSGGREK